MQLLFQHKELEFEEVLQQISSHFINAESVASFRQHTFSTEEEIIQELHAVSEYNSSYENENSIEFNSYETLEEEYNTMHIEGYVLPASSFLKILHMCNSFFKLHKSISKFKEYYPCLEQKIAQVEVEKNITKLIKTVFSKYGEIKNDASPELAKLRNEKNEKLKIHKENFDKTLQHYRKQGFLNEINESEVDGMRVLAVIAMHKKNVKGVVRGMSKTGSILFMEPTSVSKINKDIQHIEEEEKREIRKILQQLTFTISEYQPLIEEYQAHLIELDRIQAKAKYAQDIDAILPTINAEQKIDLKNAFHPILYFQNKKNKEKTLSQDIQLNKNQRIIAISGPNAGGKSITLKTIGLLQLMIQNGILIPVHPNSSIGFFEEILTDIGDNQSIENHLSTYSARLQRMAEILPKANAKTLILIDEFGTGSDPELGGALAEAFLEFLYETQSYCVVTTHYTNIKLKVEELKNAINASMLFDKNTLEPLYKLEIGQAGSSFTFEVAEKNKIPKALIDHAKSKIVKGKMNIENTLVKIQQEKFEIEKLKNSLQKRSEKSEEKHQNIEDTQDKLINKLSDFKELYQLEQKKLQFGKKLEDYIEQYSNGSSKRDIIKSFTKLLEQEKYKNLTQEKKISNKKRKNTAFKLQKDLEKKEEKIEQNITFKTEKLKIHFKNGMRVKIKGSTTVGTIDKIEKEKATINYGNFITKISIFELEKV